MNNFIDLRKRYESFYGEEPCPSQQIKDIEERLGIRLPKDFKDISTFYSGGLLGGISQFSITSDADEFSILNVTLRLRSAIGLSKEYIVIAEPAESIIVLNASSAPAVIWCDAVEARSINTGDFSGSVDTWESYEDFFAYLLQQEELEQSGS